MLVGIQLGSLRGASIRSSSMATGSGNRGGKRGPSQLERALVFGIPILIAVVVLIWLYLTHRK